jgi:hypothetical protein
MQLILECQSRNRHSSASASCKAENANGGTTALPLSHSRVWRGPQEGAMSPHARFQRVRSS